MVVLAYKLGLLPGALIFPGNLYEGHIPSSALYQASILMQNLAVHQEPVLCPEFWADQHPRRTVLASCHNARIDLEWLEQLHANDALRMVIIRSNIRGKALKSLCGVPVQQVVQSA